MSTADEAVEAMNSLNKTQYNGQQITVEKDKQKRAIVQPQTASSASSVAPTTTLWVNGLSTDTKAADLKMLFIKYGKVTGAKVVTSAKNPGSKCFGLVTMSTVDEVNLCIEKLNKTEFHGRIISLEKAKSDVKTQVKVVADSTTPSKATSTDGSDKVSNEQNSSKKPVDIKETKTKSSQPSSDKPKEQVQNTKKDENILSLDKIKEERERERKMQSERAERERERRRQRDLERERRLQREEASRVARERERLRTEKMRLERERVQAERTRLELERQRQRNERELEQERARMEQQRAAQNAHTASPFRSELKRSAVDDPYLSSSKRPSLDSSQYTSYNSYVTGSRTMDKGGTLDAAPYSSYRDAGQRGYNASPYSSPAAHLNTSGVSANQWQSGNSSSFRGNAGYTDSSRQYGANFGTSAANNSYLGTSGGNQSYKWY